MDNMDFLLDQDLNDNVEINNININDPITCNEFLKRSDLSIYCMNVRCIKKNFDDTVAVLDSIEHRFGFIILTEAWLKDSINIPGITGYSSHNTNKNYLQNDGIVVYIRNDILASVEEIIIPHANCLKLQLSNNVCVIAVYRSPSQAHIDNFLEHLNDLLHSVSTCNHEVILCGDININILDTNNSKCQQYLSLMTYHGLKPCITSPTRVTSSTESCIDHIMLKSKVDPQSAVFRTSVTDHFATILKYPKSFVLKSQKIDVKPKLIIDNDLLNSKLKEEKWNTVLSTSDVNTATNNFITCLKMHIENCSSTKRMHCNKKYLKPWITSGIVNCLTKRDKIHMNCRKEPNNIEQLAYYRRYRNWCTNIIRTTKQSYYKEKLHEVRGNTKQQWKIIKQALDMQKEPVSINRLNINNNIVSINDNPTLITNHVNAFFSDIGQNFANLLCKSNNTSEECLIENCNPTSSIQNACFELNQTNCNEVLKVINELKPGFSSGNDSISTMVYKQNVSELVIPITHIVNISFEKGLFPDHCKIAKVVPIFKGGDKLNINNYRPISLLNTLSKIIEKLAKIRLMTYVQKYEILSINQFGFRENMGTSDAALKVINTVVEALDAGNKAMAVFLDLSKAFDTVSHGLLLKKLNSMGVANKALDWFRTYLGNRTQRVMINDHISLKKSIVYGVPQGSVLGPILFLLYINDLCKLSFLGTSVVFADDTVLVFAGDTWDKTYAKCEAGLKTVKKWLDQNLLTLNTQKTKYITFSISSASQPSVNRSLTMHCCEHKCNCQSLERVDNIKYLGLIIDKYLKWNDHITVLTNKIRKLAYIFKTLRNMLDKVTLKSVYYALVQSLLSYNVVCWGSCHKTVLEPLNVAQKLILKIMYKKCFLYSSHLLYSESKIMTVRQLYIIQALCKFFSNIDTAIRSQQVRNTRMGSSLMYRPVNNRTSFGQRSFFCKAPLLYNRLSDNIKTIDTLNLFKKMVKNSMLAENGDFASSMLALML